MEIHNKVELESEKILPKENRLDTNYDISQHRDMRVRFLYMEIIKATAALEVAEKELIELQVKYSKCKNLYQNQSQKLVNKCNEVDTLNQDAYERYNKALKYAIKKEKEGWIPNIDFVLGQILKIAAYGKDS